MSTVITGLFESPADASAAIHTLEARGINRDCMSLIASENCPKDSFGITTHSKLPEGVAIGAGTGGAVGALVGGLAAAGTLATGGAGIIASGPIVAALAGAGAGAAGGAVVGGGIGAAIPEHEVKHYQDAIDEGAVLVGVDCQNGDMKDTAKDVFDHFDAKKVSSA
jgi:hypothetical protein